MTHAIVIPSYKRADYLMQDRRYNTLKWLSDKARSMTFLFIRSEEYVAYEKVAQKYGVKLAVIMPERISAYKEFGVRETRTELINMFQVVVDKNLIVLDDDLCFERRIDAQGHYRTDGKAPFDEAFIWLVSTTIEEPLRGLCSRGFASARKEISEQDKGLIQCFSFHMPLFKYRKDLLDFTQFSGRYMSDYWFNLNVLANGIHNRMSYEWCKSDEPRIEGGCEAAGRTIDEVNYSAVQLKKCFPEVVTLRQKETANWGPSVGVTIAWKKAFNLYYNRHKNELTGEC